MRIIGGNKGGLMISPPKKLKVRPTTDRSKEALFNILNNKLDYTQITALDLFSGTGNISYEFSSRGAEYVCAVEMNKRSIDFIKNFSQINDFNIEAMKIDVLNFLKLTDKKFNVIFADPPYDLKDEKYYEIINLIFKNRILKNDGFLIVEHSSKTQLNQHDLFFENRKYGDSIFSFYKYINNWFSVFSLKIINLIYEIFNYHLFLL